MEVVCREEYLGLSRVSGYKVEISIPAREVGAIIHRYPGMRTKQITALWDIYPGVAFHEIVAIIEAYVGVNGDPG